MSNVGHSMNGPIAKRTKAMAQLNLTNQILKM